MAETAMIHAGDGNLHPLNMFDANNPASFHAAEELGADILKLCVEVGGCLTGEHGVGIEKRDLMPVQFKAATADMRDADRRKLFAENALAFYRIELPEKV